jgi:FG-GAP repeat
LRDEFSVGARARPAGEFISIRSCLQAVTWVDVQVGDFNGDGKADIVGRVQQSGQWWAGISNGSFFNNSLWATWNPNVTWVDVHTGDFA